MECLYEPHSASNKDILLRERLGTSNSVCAYWTICLQPLERLVVAMKLIQRDWPSWPPSLWLVKYSHRVLSQEGNGSGSTALWHRVPVRNSHFIFDRNTRS